MSTRIVGIGGGIGASRLWTAIARSAPDIDLTVIVNTGDDMWLNGLRICPDLDTVTYALAGRQDVERGWGVKGESWRSNDALRELGGEPWFGLGDVDLATHLLRTGELLRGVPLSKITRRIGDAMGVKAVLLPSTDEEVETHVVTKEHGILHYEEYLVKHGAAPTVISSETTGLDAATPAPGVLEAIAAADVIVLGPSNPVASIAPVVDVPGVRDAIARSSAPVVAVTPIVNGIPISDFGEARRAISRIALLEARKLEPTAYGVAHLYEGLADRFLLDSADSELAAPIRALGMDVVVLDTLIHRGAPELPVIDAVRSTPKRASSTSGTE